MSLIEEPITSREPTTTRLQEVQRLSDVFLVGVTIAQNERKGEKAGFFAVAGQTAWCGEKIPDHPQRTQLLGDWEAKQWETNSLLPKHSSGSYRKEV